MTTGTIRKIVKIDEEKCDGCGACAIACAEGALKIIDGKARLISETYCDGLGACLGECPQDAIIIEERPAAQFDENAVEIHLHNINAAAKTPAACPSVNIKSFGHENAATAPEKESTAVMQSRLNHWPVQLALVPPNAPFLKGKDLVLAAHCVPFAYAGFHRDFLGENTALLIACPKLDNFQAHQAKLNEILKQSGIKSLKVLHMEVPCCSGLVYMARQAIQASGSAVPFTEATIGVRGERLSG